MERTISRVPKWQHSMKIHGGLSSPGKPICNIVEKDQSLGGLGIDRASKYDQPLFQFHTGEYFGFGFGRKCSRFAGAALFLRQQTAFTDFESHIPSRAHHDLDLNHRDNGGMGRLR